MRANDETTRIGRELYERYGKPLEASHWGEFVSISHDGRTLVAPTLVDAMERGSAEFGSENFVFKIGDRVVGMIR